MIQEIQQLLELEIQALKNIPMNDSYEKAINLIYQKVHHENGKVITSGMGKGGQTAINISTTFSSTGTPAVFLHPSDAQHGDLGVMQSNDVLLLISNSGKTREILELIALTEQLYAHIPIIVITGNPDSPLTKKADVCLLSGNPKEICPLGLTPTTSMTTMMVIGDILVVQMMKKINFTNEDYARRHHGGYLGEKSRKASTNTDNRKYRI